MRNSTVDNQFFLMNETLRSTATAQITPREALKQPLPNSPLTPK